MVGHNWGAEHAERWIWMQGAGFEGRDPGDYFDMAVGRIKVGPDHPWIGNAMLLDGRAAARRLRAASATEMNEAPTSLRVRRSAARVT